MWNDLSRELAKDIGATNTSDPLRLAEEYSAYFGTQALHDLIHTKISDLTWVPGELHINLLKLPWSEVLTTNWDTLLERAAQCVTQPVYTVVNKQEDLSSSRRPRIVKLHGTVGLSTQLTFTQEDYRRYPSENAAFVNFARHVFIENELCLLGFSGDDPNFLQWAGWVRDHLTNHARKIYLVGCLSLTPSKRKYLESINVSPIDLSDLVSSYDDIDIKHSKANELFIKALNDLKPKSPWEWQPYVGKLSINQSTEIRKQERDSAYAAKLLEEQLPALEQERLSYPNWLVCPHVLRSPLINVMHPRPTPAILEQLSEDKKDKLMHELAWRHKVTLEPVPGWLVDHLLEIIDFSQPRHVSKKERLEIAVTVLENSRWLEEPRRSQSKSTATEAIENYSTHWTDAKTWLTYLQALDARDQFDFIQLEALIEELKVDSPEWMLRKAALLSELGFFEQSKSLIDEAHSELLKQYRNDRDSLHILSRLAWAQWIRNASDLSNFSPNVDEFYFDFKVKKCEPSDSIRFIESQIAKQEKLISDSHGITPSFEPGKFRDHSKTVFLGQSTPPIILLEKLVTEAGIPLRWKNVNLLVDPAHRALSLIDQGEEERQVLSIRVANSETSESITKTFSRIAVASLPEKLVSQLFHRCMHAAKYWSNKLRSGTDDQKRIAPTKLRVFLEVLARIVVRVAPDKALSAFNLAMEFGKQPEICHRWIWSALGHLIDYAIRSIPEIQQKSILENALQFPLVHEFSSAGEEWPNPVIENPGPREANPQIDARILSIIQSIENAKPSSQDAVIRLLPLIEKNFLKPNELDLLASQIWDNLPKDQDLPNIGVMNFAFLLLPSKYPEEIKSRVRRIIYEFDDSSVNNSNCLEEMIGASSLNDTSIAPEEKQSLRIFNLLTSWRPTNVTDDYPFFPKHYDIGTLVGEALSLSIVPSLSKKDLNDENFSKLYELYQTRASISLAKAFVYFASNEPELEMTVERILRLGLQSKDANEVSYAADALVEWCKSSQLETPRKLATRMVYLIESGRMIGLSALLRAARHLLFDKNLCQEDIATLCECLPNVFEDTEYARIIPESKDAVSISVVRSEIIKTSRELCKLSESKNLERLQRIIKDGKNDPLPEVRYA